MSDIEKKLRSIDVTIDCLTLFNFIKDTYDENEALNCVLWLIDEEGEIE